MVIHIIYGLMGVCLLSILSFPIWGLWYARRKIGKFPGNREDLDLVRRQQGRWNPYNKSTVRIYQIIIFTFLLLYAILSILIS